jgi:hypothetical protein
MRGGLEYMRGCIVCTCVVIQNRTNRVGGVVIISVFLPIVVGRGLSMVRPNNDYENDISSLSAQRAA